MQLLAGAHNLSARMELKARGDAPIDGSMIGHRAICPDRTMVLSWANSMYTHTHIYVNNFFGESIFTDLLL